MGPLLLMAAGTLALVGGLLVLRSFGPRWRIGRLLASAPLMTTEEARALAEAGQERYVRVVGRVDGEDSFEDDRGQPLVFRRTRIEARRSGRWERLDERVERVRFEVREGLVPIGVDDLVLDDGLVVMPREAVGTAAEAADRLPREMPPETPIRLVIEQVSSVDHAVVAGLPRRHGDDVVMTADRTRPLIVTTLEVPEAMRVLAGGKRRRSWLAAGLLLGGLVLLALGLGWLLVQVALPATALGASPSPGSGGDTRSSGEGAGLVGEPLLAILAVILIGIVSAAATAAYARLTQARGRDDAAGRGAGRTPP